MIETMARAMDSSSLRNIKGLVSDLISSQRVSGIWYWPKSSFVRISFLEMHRHMKPFLLGFQFDASSITSLSVRMLVKLEQVGITGSWAALLEANQIIIIIAIGNQRGNLRRKKARKKKAQLRILLAIFSFISRL